jgi:hypothetical protein
MACRYAAHPISGIDEVQDKQKIAAKPLGWPRIIHGELRSNGNNGNKISDRVCPWTLYLKLAKSK